MITRSFVSQRYRKCRRDGNERTSSALLLRLASSTTASLSLHRPRGKATKRSDTRKHRVHSGEADKGASAAIPFVSRRSPRLGGATPASNVTAAPVAAFSPKESHAATSTSKSTSRSTLKARCSSRQAGSKAGHSKVTNESKESTNDGCRHRYPLRPQAPQSCVTSSMYPSTRRSLHNHDAALAALAKLIVGEPRHGRRGGGPTAPPPTVVWITGAGLSVASGIRPFRSNPPAASLSTGGRGVVGATSGIWDEVLWTMATRAAFRKNPAHWYRHFWNVYFRHESLSVVAPDRPGVTRSIQPNAGHEALDALLQSFENCRHVTQNIDGLLQAPPAKASSQQRFVEVHGRVGLYKCCPDEDESSSDDDSESDEPKEQRRRLPIPLGNRCKYRRKKQATAQPSPCPYRFSKALTASQLVYRKRASNVETPSTNKGQEPNANATVDSVPRCPSCRNTVMPMALLFDEPYHSHTFYQFDVVEDWIAQADVLVFCGTSFAPVLITHVALAQARRHEIPVYNFNLVPMASSTTTTTHATSVLNTARLDITDILGPAEVTLPKLLDHCRRLQQGAR